MSMNQFMEMVPNKFIVVLGKLHATIFGELGKHIKELGFNTTEFLILYAIAANGALTIQDIASRIFMTSGSMTYTVDKLEQRGLIKRVRSDVDRRKIFIDFTAKGQDVWSNVLEVHMAYLEKAFENIDKQIMSETIESMKLIGKSFE